MSLRAFAATVAVLVPAGWHGSDATIENDGKKIRPLKQEVVIDGARVTVEADRSLITTGDPVIVKLRAFSDEPKDVAVDLTVMSSDDEFGSRVAGPAHSIDKEHFTLHADQDGGKVVDTRIVMQPPGGADKIDWFRIFVAAKGTKISAFGGAGDDDVAAISVLGWSTNDYGVTITPKGKLTSGEPFDVAVRLENQTADTVKRRPYVHLGTAVGTSDIEEGEDFKIEELGDEYVADERWRPGAAFTRHYRVTPLRPDIKSVTFIASAYTWGEDMSPVTAGGMEASTFKIKPVPAAVAAR